MGKTIFGFLLVNWLVLTFEIKGVTICLSKVAQDENETKIMQKIRSYLMI